MGKIKVIGYQELIDVPDEAARELKQKRQDGTIKDNEQVSIGTFSGENREIRFIIVGEKVEEQQNEQFKGWLEARHKLLDLSPGDRAKQSSWGHFCLTYYSFTGKQASESMREDIVNAATLFYEKNPKWARPSLKYWMQVLEKSGVKTTKKITQIGYEHAFKILERCEAEELQIVGSVII